MSNTVTINYLINGCITFLGVVLATYPIALLVYFRWVILQRMVQTTIDDFRKNRFFAGSKQHEREQKVRDEFAQAFALSIFLVPVLFLAIVYFIGFAMLLGLYFHWVLPDDGDHADFLLAAEPVLLTFVGVFIFNMGHSLRRLYLYDLTETVFWHAIYRTLLSMSLGVVMVVLYPVQLNWDTSEPNRVYFASFFFVGFVTNRVFRSLLDFIGSKTSKYLGESSREIPLSALQGISIWNEFRLEEEGIDNVQHLATCDLMRLAIRTCYEIRTLVDWVDQAILFHSLGKENAILLQKKGLFLGALDFAWSEESLRKDPTPAQKIGAVLNTDEFFVRQAMISLNGDAHVDEIWNLWLKPGGSKDAENEHSRDDEKQP